MLASALIILSSSLVLIGLVFYSSELQIVRMPIHPMRINDVPVTILGWERKEKNDEDHGNIVVDDFHYNRKNTTSVYEDILSMQKPKFLRHYKNPCWFEKTLRCLPYFDIIGVSKSGTTDLLERIAKHPQVLKIVRWKETRYWAWKRYGECEYSKNCTGGGKKWTFDDYVNLFPSNAIWNSTKDNSKWHNLIKGTDDPAELYGIYFWKRIPQNDPELDEPTYITPHLIKHMNPDIKLIVLLRQPSERVYSSFLFRNLGKTPWRFHREVSKAISGMKKCLQIHSIRACLLNETLMYEVFTKLPIHGSFYSVLLKEWFSVFPREQFLILRTEDYQRNVVRHLSAVFKFLDLDPISKKQLLKIRKLPQANKTNRTRKSEKMFMETKLMLDEFLQQYNDDLPELLNDEKYTWNDVKYTNTIVKLAFEAEFVEMCVKFRNISTGVGTTGSMKRLRDICYALKTQNLKSFLIDADDEYSDIENLLSFAKSVIRYASSRS